MDFEVVVYEWFMWLIVVNIKSYACLGCLLLSVKKLVIEFLQPVLSGCVEVGIDLGISGTLFEYFQNVARSSNVDFATFLELGDMKVLSQSSFGSIITCECQ